MMNTRSITLGLILWIVMLICPAVYAQEVCDVGWFGSSCQYECHCTNNNCDNKGDCRVGDTCVKGWFGPQCQYGFLEDISVYFNDSTLSTGNTYKCNNQRSAVVDNRTIDIHCDVDVEVDQVTYKGEAVGYLCSIYVSGGRNVALKQSQVNQSSTYSGPNNFDASNAVDGNTDQNAASGSCTHTEREANPNWNVQFAQISDVNRYVLYNRDANQVRLKGFVLTSFDQNSQQVFKYTDQESNSQSVYDFATATNTSSIKRVNVIATNKQDGPFLTLCEVEIYGDSHCPAGKYGRECDHNCNCATEIEQCFVSTGGCPSGCAAGYMGERCDQPCQPGTYGPNCATTCSTNCQDQLKCDHINGTCEECVSGKQGDLCDLECSTTTYGPRCISTCSTNCADNKCNGTTGVCDNCPDGKIGDQCDTDCEEGKYGHQCMLTCSTNCKDAGDCDPKDGRCTNGCSDGFMGDLCNAMTSEGGLADFLPAIVGAIVGVLAIVAIIVLGVFFCRRRRSKKSEASSSILENNQKNRQPSKTDENNPYMESGLNNPYMESGLNNPYMESGLNNPYMESGLNNPYMEAGDISENPYHSADTATESSHIQSAITEPKPPVKPKHTNGTSTSEKKEEESQPYYNINSSNKFRSTTIAIGDLQAFVATNDKSFFKTQFESISENKSATTKVGLSTENKQKNRYKNICAYDHSRVCLEAGKHGENGDYINASYIEGYKGEEKFIASQGPTKLILVDFVRMLWEQRTEKVVMLTKLFEEGKMKCEQYWPDDDKRHFGEIKMVLTTTEVFADYTIRRLKLCKKGYPDQLLTHFHFTSWPDKGVPTIPWGLVDFEQRVASYPTENPIVVHCSAGVGRTGTFIALRNVMRQAEDTGYVDCFDTVKKLRNDRINMVQTAEQYEFLHRAAQVAMVCLGTTVTSGDIQERIAKLQSKSTSGQTHMEEEFMAVCSVCEEAGESSVKEDPVADSSKVVYENSGKVIYENSSKAVNKHKDRLKNVPPKEQYRPILSCENDDMGKYINAVLVPSFRKLDQQLLTQLPLPTTVTDFWRLVTQYKVSLVVAFKLDCDDRDPSIAHYLPLNEGDEMSIPLYNIKSGSISRGDIAEVQDVTVQAVGVDKRRKSMPVFLSDQHHLTHVTYMGTDLNPNKLLALIKVLREHFPGPEGRVIFMCRNGASYSGLVCVLTLLLDRMDHDLRLTVPLVVGAIKSIRPQVIPTLDQYKLLYQILHMYNESSNVYSNFGEAQTPENERKRIEEQHKDIYANT